MDNMTTFTSSKLRELLDKSPKGRPAIQRLVNEGTELIRKQGGLSYIMKDERMICQYDDGHGKHCAFWPAIKKYDEDMEEQGAASLMRFHQNATEDYVLHQYVMDIPDEVASRWQSCHDRCVEVVGDGPGEVMHAFNANVEEFCKVLGLEYPQPNTEPK